MADRPEFSHRRERHGVIGPFSGRQLVIAFVAVLIAGVVLIGVTTPLGNTANGPLRSTRRRPYLISSPPPVGLRTARPHPNSASRTPRTADVPADGFNGAPIRLPTFAQGRPDTLTTWCPPCQSEVPILRDVSARYKDQGWCSSRSRSSGAGRRRGLREILARLHDRLRRDRADLPRVGKAFGLPTHVFIDPNG
jgi:thiol-disulfide isomerase/thioredoxin